MKHRDNTLHTKRFANGKQVFVHGGKTARNYREKSVDVVIYDELAAFDEDVEKEGSPTTLSDKRLEGVTAQRDAYLAELKSPRGEVAAMESALEWRRENARQLLAALEQREQALAAAHDEIRGHR